MANVAKTVKLNTGAIMPTVGFGVYLMDPSQCARACQDAISLGYRHIDSAQYYQNEAEVGEGVRNSGIPREDIFITSKVYQDNFGYDKTLKSVRESVEKLGFGKAGYYDLFLIHSAHLGREVRLATYKALLQAKAEGIVRSVGVSNFSQKHIEEIEQAGLELPAVNQIELHPFCQQRPIVEYCQSKGIVIQAYTPLIRGSEAGKGKGIDHEVVRKIAAKNGKTPAQVVLRWSLQKGHVPLPKATSRQRIEENISVFDFNLDAEDMAALEALDQGAAGAVTWNPVNVE